MKINIYDLKEIGFIIYKARMKKGYTQSQLGVLCFESKNNISSIENGNGKRLTFERITKILKPLNIELKCCTIEN